MISRLVIFLLFAVSVTTMYAQSTESLKANAEHNVGGKDSINTSENESSLSPGAYANAIQALPDGFNGMVLGSTLEEVKKSLATHDMFVYTEKDFPTLSSQDSRIITIDGKGFIDTGYLFFSRDDVLISFALFFDKSYIDYGTIYNNLEQKYGRPNINVNTAHWSNDRISLYLEKPLSVKYVLEEGIDVNAEQKQSNILAEDREKFMELF